MTTPARPQPPVRRQAVLEVVTTEQLSPHLIRVTAGGEGFAAFNDNDSTDKYVKIFFADPAHELTPPYDMEGLRDTAPERMPVRRTYTVRKVDHEARTLTIDFVVHGDEGVAGPWAVRAVPGDVLVLVGAGGGYAPDPQAPWHLLVGDLTAIPAISSALEALPETAQGELLLELEDPEDAASIQPPAGIRFQVVQPAADAEEAAQTLVTAVRALPWREGTPHAFVHGERESVKLLRRHLVGERGVPSDRLSISAYWARGRTEDRFQAEKREPVGQIA